MISMDNYSAVEPLEGKIEVLKKGYIEYYNSLREDEFHPQKIIISSDLLVIENESLEKVILLYSNKLIILKRVDNNILKNILEYNDINYIVDEEISSSSCLTILYGTDREERIFYDSKGYSIAKALLYDLRKLIVSKAAILKGESKPNYKLSDLEQSSYIGASIAKNAILDNSAIIGSLQQKRVYNYSWWILRKILTNTHVTIINENEVVVFIEKFNDKRKRNVSGDLFFIPIKALMSISIEATGKGMIMRYLFYSGRKFELFYQNEKTDELLKVMSFINGILSGKN